MTINDRVKVIHFRSFKLTHLQHFFFSKAAAEIHTDQRLLKRKSAFAIAGSGLIKAIESGSIPNARRKPSVHEAALQHECF